MACQTAWKGKVGREQQSAAALAGPDTKNVGRQFVKLRLTKIIAVPYEIEKILGCLTLKMNQFGENWSSRGNAILHFDAFELQLMLKKMV